MTAQLTILDEIGLRLDSIKEENGYSCDVRKIKRARLTPFTSGDIPAINYWGGADTINERAHGKNLHSLDVTVELHDKTRDKPFTDIAYQRGADVVTAVFRDSTSPRVDDTPSIALGYIVDAIQVNSVTPMIGEGQAPYCGVVVNFTVLYKTELSNPYTIIV